MLLHQILPKLGASIKQKKLTEALQCLQALGYCGDEALSLLAYLQGFGGAS